ncbi:hypothetical protein BDV96DRAFT_645539 [Lophiotrema nucula]|uniref:Plus3 domain-containing protein n=1 Tax=Lophiotrema nucula TaxID=690887 RepID=A0A6A5ZAU6_9PLEO|nr:hypothetical protein BDV96DRAFT_645539 [Lophiotrema nucula]
MADLDDELFALAGGDDEAEIEEGEASSVAASSPNSLGSGAMDESDSDREDDQVPDNEHNVPFPLDGKYLNSKDRSYINGLPQLERERILGERAEQMSKLKFQNELARRAKQAESSAPGERKRKASSLEPEDSQRKSSRQKVKPKTNDKLEAYKIAREQRGQQRQRDTDRRNGRRRSSSADRGDGSDLDAEGESEVDWDEPKPTATREEPPATVEHFDYVRVSRGLFGKVCFYPGFEDAMSGTFARIGVGQDAQKRTLYKMAQIKGFSKGKPYVFEGKNGQRIATNQYVVAQHGSVKKEYTFLYLSNQRFTEGDLEAYKQSLSETNSKVPTQSYLKRKFDDIRALENHNWTDEDISAKLLKQNEFSHLLHTSNGHSSVSTPQAPRQDPGMRIAELNKANRKADSERVRKALIEERKQRDIARKKREAEHAAKVKVEAEKKAAEEAKAKMLKVPTIDDLFEGSDRSRSATPAISRVGTPKPGEKKKGLPTFRKPKMEDDIIASIDIGVDIEI